MIQLRENRGFSCIFTIHIALFSMQKWGIITSIQQLRWIATFLAGQQQINYRQRLSFQAKQSSPNNDVYCLKKRRNSVEIVWKIEKRIIDFWEREGKSVVLPFLLVLDEKQRKSQDVAEQKKEMMQGEIYVSQATRVRKRGSSKEKI